MYFISSRTAQCRCFVVFTPSGGGDSSLEKYILTLAIFLRFLLALQVSYIIKDNMHNYGGEGVFKVMIASTDFV